MVPWEKTVLPDGTNTGFTLTGIFGADIPVTPYSAPGSPWVLTFAVETMPTDLAFVDPSGIFGIDTTSVLRLSKGNRNLLP